MSMTESEKMIYILGEVFTVLRNISGQLTAGSEFWYPRTRWPEFRFIWKLIAVVEKNNVDASLESLMATNPGAIPEFYDKVRKLVEKLADLPSTDITKKPLARMTELELAPCSQIIEQLASKTTHVTAEGSGGKYITQDQLDDLGFSNVDAMELNRILLSKEGTEEVRISTAVAHLRDKKLVFMPTGEPTETDKNYLGQQIAFAKKLIEISFDNVDVTDGIAVLFANGSVGKEGERIAGYSWKYLGKDGDNWRFKALEREPGSSYAAPDHLRVITGSSNMTLEKGAKIMNGIAVDKGGYALGDENFILQPDYIITVIMEQTPKNHNDQVNRKFLERQEKFKLNFYVPSPTSGVTIATGFDIGKHSKEQLDAIFGHNHFLREEYKKYAELEGKDAYEAIEVTGYNIHSTHGITKDQAYATDELVIAYIRKRIVTTYNNYIDSIDSIDSIDGNIYFDDLPLEAQTVLYSLGHHRGQGKGRIPVEVMRGINDATAAAGVDILMVDYSVAANALLDFATNTETGEDLETGENSKFIGRRQEEAAFLRRSIYKNAYNMYIDEDYKEKLEETPFDKLTEEYKVLVLVLGYQSEKLGNIDPIMGWIDEKNYKEANTAIEDLYDDVMYPNTTIEDSGTMNQAQIDNARATIFLYDKKEIAKVEGYPESTAKGVNTN